MISPSSPEPLCDINAQFRAVCDRDHPKMAMWVAAGTPLPTEPWPQRGCYNKPFNCGGWLICRHYHDTLQLGYCPTDRTLADILGYLEPKWDAGLNAVVVRALNGDGCVITEMAVSPHRAGEAYHLVKRHGTPELTTIAAVHERRRILCASETA